MRRLLKGPSLRAACQERNSCLDHTTLAPVSGLCQNGGFCRDIVHGSYACMCPKPYAGPRCQYHDPCQPSPCASNGICLSWLVPAHGTRVQPLVRTKGKVLAPAVADVRGLANDGTGYTCRCKNGYGGPTCGSKLVTGANSGVCATNNGGCLNHGKCVSLFGKLHAWVIQYSLWMSLNQIFPSFTFM